MRESDGRVGGIYVLVFEGSVQQGCDDVTLSPPAIPCASSVLYSLQKQKNASASTNGLTHERVNITVAPLQYYLQQWRFEGSCLRPPRSSSLAKDGIYPSTHQQPHQPTIIPATLPANAAPSILARVSMMNLRSLTSDFAHRGQQERQAHNNKETFGHALRGVVTPC